MRAHQLAGGVAQADVAEVGDDVADVLQERVAVARVERTDLRALGQTRQRKFGVAQQELQVIRRGAGETPGLAVRAVVAFDRECGGQGGVHRGLVGCRARCMSQRPALGNTVSTPV